MESLLSPPLNIQLVDTSPAQSYEVVQNSLSAPLDDHELLPYVIGGNTHQTKNRLYQMRDEVTVLRRNSKRGSSRHPHTSKKQKHDPSKPRRKSKSSTQAVVS
ncbi:hypothetical protein PTTG_29243 [Puccinia triticina 1-1 BBBD Race 1]|uniref:Uncharacterized protein n=2 Tax=Puccinia triticina TaxID=208348 RepID=A0A180G5N1_PUCT1|nr:uncharacterized protein PtA15_6A93 [Puccinia triticina]OAV87904.1 hypothetical protein PTTG_29243 [Puccinia triticina 1-1 BBBD Race 1]WAQ85465.1 hypothetical protein PtA15_6A93 [Puccinia triticina]WAR55348.1 hypothetical protein PtB15_6B88 [Puccinia triticina]